jgi:hypothetical protein
MLLSSFKLAGRHLFGAAFYSHRLEDNCGPSNFLELATALFHGNAETKLSVLHRKMIIRVVKSMSAALHRSQVQSGAGA